MQLSEWCMSYLRHKDILERKIKDISLQDEKISIERKDGNACAFCNPDFQKITLDSVGKYVKYYCVTLHSKKNLDALLERWEELAKYSQIVCIFVDLDTNAKWIVMPYSHNRILHGDLKKGLQSLFDNCS